MQKVHLIFGVVVLLVFAGTGQWMLGFVPDLPADQQMMRMAYRAGHIYIMFSGLLHVMLGLSYPLVTARPWAHFQTLISLGLIAATMAIIAGFSWEPALGQIDRPITGLSVIATLVLSALMFAVVLYTRWQERRS